MVTQMVGIRFATPTGWRIVFLLSCSLSLLQILTSPLMVESPVWLLKRRHFDDYHKVVSKLWGRKPPAELGKFSEVAGILAFSFIHSFSQRNLFLRKHSNLTTIIFQMSTFHNSSHSESFEGLLLLSVSQCCLSRYPVCDWPFRLYLKII